jgi:dTDP-4-dehydrorhamnose reductase
LTEHQVSGTDLPDLDLTDASAVEGLVKAQHPEVVIHCAAMTAVDACETARDQAFAVNALGSANLARACHLHGARLIAISTDYVFAGNLDRPYHEWDEAAPRTIYGQSKLAGEQAIAQHCPDHTILRIAWLYGPGGPSFVHTMLKLGQQDGDPLRVVDDQIGNPTSTDAVADLLLQILQKPIPGIVHGTCEGEVSWCGFTKEIFRLRGLRRGVVACTTAEYPRPAPRPANSRLEKRALRLARFPLMPTWQETLARFFQEHMHA